MSQQRTLTNEPVEAEPVVFYRPVNSDGRMVAPEETPISAAGKVESLLDYIKDKKLKYPSSVSESKMKETPQELIQQIIYDGADASTNVKLLLGNFCDNLVSQQRAENKYAMLVVYGSNALLAHVKAKRGMSLEEESGDVQLVRRFLDADNILSAAYFERVDDSEIRFSHFTDTDSGSFRSYLGVSKKRFNFRKKNVQFVCYYEGRAGMSCKFEFTNDQIENMWLQEQSLHITDNRLLFNAGREHIIKEVRWGGETYDSVQNWKADFKEYSYALTGQRRRYNELKILPTDGGRSAYEDDVEVVDEKENLIITDGDDEEIRPKGELPPNIHSIYANSFIDLDSQYGADIFRDIIETSEVSLYHPSGEIASEDVRVGHLSLLNVERDEIAPERHNLLRTIWKHTDNASGETLRRCLGFVFLHVLSSEVDKPFENGIRQIINLNHGTTRQHAVVTTKEQQGNGLIEYKDKADLGKEDPAKSIVENIQKEKKEHDEKVFLWGIDEKSRRVDGLRKQKWGDDRVSGIEEEVVNRLREEDIEYTEYEMFSLPIGEDESRCILIGILH